MRKIIKLMLLTIVFTSGFAGCRAAVEPKVIVPRVFENEHFTAQITTYPGEKPGDLKPLFAMLYSDWQALCVTGKFKNIGTPESPRWELKISPAAKTGFLIIPKYFTYRNSKTGKLEKYPASKTCSPYVNNIILAPRFYHHWSDIQLYMVVEYLGRIYKIRVPLNKKKIYVYCKPGYDYLWTAGSESISK